MSPLLDTLLVIVLVSAAAVYLVVRKVRSLKRISRAWDTGHADSCHHCPAIQIRQAQRAKLEAKFEK